MASEQAAAYYYHGLILDESTEENVHAKAVSCFHAAEQFLKESKTACINFCLAAPVTRLLVSIPWKSSFAIHSDELITTKYSFTHACVLQCR